MGHLLSMAYVFAIADVAGAKVLLRFEDHDRQRCRKEYEQAILDDIAWLGFIPDNWPYVVRQSERGERYRQVMGQLRQEGYTYGCSCSRKDVAALEDQVGEELLYPGLCRDKGLEVKEGVGIRLRVAQGTERCIDLMQGAIEQVPAQQCGDFLLQDTRGNYTYNFAVVVDDLDQGVNLIIRGKDVMHCTGRQLQLGRFLGRQETPLFAHHSLIYDTTGMKLSKRSLSEGIIKRRLAGDAAADVLGEALWLGGLLEAPYPVKAHDIAAAFRFPNSFC